MKKNNLIFDLGFHNGDDTDFYLKKGFDVVAVEADPRLVRKGEKRFNSFIKKGKLTLLNRAVSDMAGVRKFYVNVRRPDWSSCDKRLAEIDGSHARVIKVDTVMLRDLCDEFGIPHYLKVDIEGCDIVVAHHLFNLPEKPKYVSFETSKQTYAALFSWLYMAGYKKFQLINQLKHSERTITRLQKAGEGKSIHYQFTQYSSGFFGQDLPREKWLSYDDALSRYLKYKELKVIDNQELALGWLDLHAQW